MELWTSPTPNGWKVTIMLEELKEAGVELPEIKVVLVDLFEREQFSKAFTQISPNQKIPGLRDGNQTIMESGAILMYLAEKFPSSLLPEGDNRWIVMQWLFWQVGGIGPIFGNKLAYTRYMEDVPGEQKAHPLERFNNEAQRLLRVMNKQLEDKKYLCRDNFTIADIACYPWIRGYKWSKIDITIHEHVVAWAERVRARPGVERGLAFGVKRDEVDTWSADTRAKYAKGGASIASNASIKSDR